MIVIEEIERYATTYYMPFSLKRIIDTGRHRGLGLICTTRRVKRLNNDIPANSDHVIVFRQHLLNDVQYLADWIGDEAYRLPTLPEFWFLWYVDEEGKTHICKKV
jgi:transposase